MITVNLDSYKNVCYNCLCFEEKLLVLTRFNKTGEQKLKHESVRAGRLRTAADD